MDQLTKKYHNMFVAAATFNWVVALSFIKPATICSLVGVTPVPNEDLMLHIFCLLVATFGVLYYETSKDFVGNANVIRVCMVAKLIVVLITVANVVMGTISWQIIPLVSGDAVFAFLFHNALQDLDATKKK